MKKIKRGDTRAITRDGREVSQLTWFKVSESIYKVVGVLDEKIHSWTEQGEVTTELPHPDDIFAVPEYEYKVLFKNADGDYLTSDHYYKSKKAFELRRLSVHFILLIEDSKREVKD